MVCSNILVGVFCHQAQTSSPILVGKSVCNDKEGEFKSLLQPQGEYDMHHLCTHFLVRYSCNLMGKNLDWHAYTHTPQY